MGDRVWADTNGNGIQGGIELGLPGVDVRLINCATNQAVKFAITNATGNYLFSNIPVGSYAIEVDLIKNLNLAGARFSPSLISTDRNSDSNIDPTTRTATTARTFCTTLVSGQVDKSVDIGIIPPVVSVNKLPLAVNDNYSGSVGTAFSKNVTSNDTPVDNVNVVAKASGTLPPGLTLSSTGALTGTPSTSGIYSFTYTLTDSNGDRSTATVKVTIGQAKQYSPITCNLVPLGNKNNVNIYTAYTQGGGGLPIGEHTTSNFVPAESYKLVKTIPWGSLKPEIIAQGWASGTFPDYNDLALHPTPVPMIVNPTHVDQYSYMLQVTSFAEVNTLTQVVGYNAAGNEVVRSQWCTIGSSPIALDLNGDGKIARADARVSFDLSGDGNSDDVQEWFGNGDGILIDTRILGEMSGRQLFGDEGGRYTDGYAKLARLDADSDGQISGDELDGLGLWVDNGNAKVDSGEIQSLGQYGIVSLPTTRTTTCLLRPH